MTEFPCIKPDFYDSFACIADRCSFSCCKEWRIHVDEESRERFRSLTLDGHPMSSLLEQEDGGGSVFRLEPDGSCPCLREDGLCRLILTHGEEVLPKGCRLFPRQIRHFPDHTEYQLMPACPVVIDMLRDARTFSLQSDVPDLLSCSGSPKSPVDEDDRLTPETLLRVRSCLLSIINDRKASPESLLLLMYVTLLDLWEKEPCPKDILGRLKRLSKKMFRWNALRQFRALEVPPAETLKETTELLLDLMDKYWQLGLYDDFIIPQAVQADRVLRGLEADPDGVCRAYQIFHKQVLPTYLPLLRNVIACELYNSLLSPEATLDTMILHYEWTTIIYAAIRQALFFCSLAAGSSGRSISDEEVRETIVTIFRMTGYDEKDIADYLDSMFQGEHIEAGYLALLLGTPDS